MAIPEFPGVLTEEILRPGPGHELHGHGVHLAALHAGPDITHGHPLAVSVGREGVARLVGHHLHIVLRAVEIGEDEGNFIIGQAGAVAAALLPLGGEEVHELVFPHGAEELAGLGRELDIEFSALGQDIIGRTDGAGIATAELQRRLPSAKVLVLTSYGEADGVAHALECGAAGVITKTAEDAEIVSVVRRIASSENFVSPEIKKMLHDDPPVPKLTPRQREILGYMVRGLTNRDIAKILSIREDTVEEHVNILLSKINATNRTEAVSIALRKQLVNL